ncbi:MAG: 3-isopropylmalate dehydratase small subunit [Lachnospiraceae bacterium]|nr:3-isopropylmalate dehydratase small subunit [Lachnospiraceae bacterium]
MKTIGKVFKYGDDINTDVIIPARYLNVTNEQELAAHCMEDLDETFVQNVSSGDVVVAGRNFGCGSSREHAPLVLRTCKIGCVVAKSYARIFYRNAINIGLPILECPEACDEIQPGDTVEVNFDTGLITDHTLNQSWQAQPFPAFIQDIIESGGLLASLGK